MDAITQPWDGLNKLKEKVKTATGSQLVDIWRSMEKFLEDIQEETNKQIYDPVLRPRKTKLREDLMLAPLPGNYLSLFNTNLTLNNVSEGQVTGAREAMRRTLVNVVQQLETKINRSQNQSLVDLFNNDETYNYTILRNEAPSFSERGSALSEVSVSDLKKLDNTWLGRAVDFLRDLLLSGAIELEHGEGALAVKQAFKFKLSELMLLQKEFQAKFLHAEREKQDLYAKLMKLTFTDGKNIFEKFALWGAKYKVPVVVENVAPGAADI